MEKSFKLDIYYVKNISFLLDVNIVQNNKLVAFKRKQYKDFKNFMKKKIAIIGAGGHGKVVGEIALLNQFEIIDFFDDKEKEIKEFPFNISGNIDYLREHLKNYNAFFVAIGENKLRSNFLEWLKKEKMNIISLVHPRSTISKFSSLEQELVFWQMLQ